MSLDLYTNKHKINKRGYTLVEVFIVIIIVGLLFLLTRNLFTNKNESILESSICVQAIYSSMQQHMNDAIAGKVVNTQGTTTEIFPDNYFISIDGSNQRITLGYNESNILRELQLNDNESLPQCENIERIMVLEDSNIQISLRSQLQSDFGSEAFSITENGEIKNEVTVNIDFCLKKSNGLSCEKFHEIHIDKRTQSIKQNRCFAFNEKCELRENEE